WRLREQMQRPPPGLSGPGGAEVVVDEGLRLDAQARPALSDRLHLLEEALRESRANLPGPAAELEAFRRYLRRILEDLPLGVCALGPDRDVVIWNRALEALAGISAREATGATLQHLKAPIGSALAAFAGCPQSQQEIRLQLNGRDRFFSLSKSAVDGAALPQSGSSTSN